MPKPLTTRRGSVRGSRTAVLRDDAARVTRAHIDAELRHAPYAKRFAADPRLVDPTLEAAFAAAAEQARAEARDAGYADGYRAGEQAAAAAADAAAAEARAAAAAAAARRDEQLQLALDALDRRLRDLERAGAPAAAAVEDTVVAMAMQLTETLLGHELAASTTPGADAIARALALAPEGEPVTARLHPDDAAALPARAAAGGRDVTVVADPRVERGGCVLDCGFTRIDAQLGPALARVRALLGDTGAAR